MYLTTVLLALILGQVASIQHCPPGWLEWNQTCYMITPTPMLWGDVQQLCRGFGARMAVPSSDQENLYMATIGRKTRSDIWIDCTDGAAEGRWICAEDEIRGTGYRKWNGRSGQPNGVPLGADGSAADFASLGRDNLWGDRGDKLQYSICEMKPMCGSSLECHAINADACG